MTHILVDDVDGSLVGVEQHHAHATLTESDAEREPIRLKAFDLLIRAGAQARRRFAVAKAVELHDQAVALALTDDERLRSFEELGDDHDSAYHGDDAQQAYSAALEIARRMNSSGDRARLCSKLAEMMTSSPGAFKHSPDPDTVEGLTTEGLAHSVDEAVTGHLQVAYGQTARLYRGSEPFGQGHVPDPEAIDKRIEAVEKARAVGERLNNLQLLWISNLALGLLYGMAGMYQANLELAMKDLEVVDRLASRIHQGDAVGARRLL